MSTITKLQEAFDALDSSLTSTSVGTAIEEMTMESIASSSELPAGYDTQNQGLQAIMNVIEQEQDTSDAYTMESIDEAIKAGVMAHGLCMNPELVTKLRSRPSEGNNMMTLESIANGPGGSINHVPWEDYTALSFDENSLEGMATFNAVVNMVAARQEPAAEALFPTKTFSPTDAVIRLGVAIPDIIKEKLHPAGGKLLNEERRRLTDGFIDHTLTESNTTEMVPFANPDGSADKFFMPSSVIGDQMVKMDKNVEVRRRPLAPNVLVNYISLCRHPGLTDGYSLDQTEQIAYGVKLKNVYVTVGEGANARVIMFPTLNLQRNEFTRAAGVGDHRDTQMVFISDDLLLTKDTVDVEGNPIPVIADNVGVNDYIVRLRVSITGEMNLRNGNTMITPSAVNISEVIDSQGDAVGTTDGVGKVVYDALKAANLAVGGVDLKAYTSNSNWRYNGPIIDIDPIEEQWMIMPGTPLTVINPPLENATASKIKAMQFAARIRSTAQALTTFLNYFEELKAYKDAASRGMKVDIVGAGRHLVDVYVNERECDVAARLINRESSERHDSLANVLIHELRDEFWNMVRDSKYRNALRFQTGNADTKPRGVVLVDNVLGQHLNMANGITRKRILGDDMDIDIFIVDDQRFKGKMWCTLSRGRPGVEDLLSYGLHAYVPEIVQELTIGRQGADRKVTRIIPRSYHLPVLPIMACINVTNIREALTNT